MFSRARRIKRENAQKALFEAAMMGNTDAVDKAIADGANVYEKDGDGDAAIHIAARCGNSSTIDHLVRRHRADVFASGCDGNTALHWAVLGGHLAIVDRLVRHYKLDATTKDIYGHTALHKAAFRGYDSIIRRLIDNYRLDVHVKDNRGNDALHWAALGGHGAVVGMLVSSYKLDVHAKNNDGQTPAMRAIENSHAVVAAKLRGYEKQFPRVPRQVRTATPSSHTSSIHYPVMPSSSPLVTGPIRTARPSSHTSGIYSPTMISSSSSTHAASSRPTASSSSSHSPLSGVAFKSNEGAQAALFKAAKMGDIAAVGKAIKAGADVYTKITSGSTALHYAAQGGHAAMVDHLMSRYGLDVQAKNYDNTTALHWAAYGGQTAMVDHLVRYGLDVQARNDDGATALHWAAENGCTAMIDHLVNRYSLDVHAKNNAGQTPAMFAKIMGKTETAIKLEAYEKQYPPCPRILGTAASSSPSTHAASSRPTASSSSSHSPLPGVAYKSKEETQKALFEAVKAGDITAINQAIQAGADVHAVDERNLTVLHWAAYNGHTHVIDCLVRYGMNILLKGYCDYNVLHAAALNGQITVVEHLVSHYGLDVHAKSSTGYTAAICARSMGKTETAVKLEAYERQYPPGEKTIIYPDFGSAATSLPLSSGGSYLGFFSPPSNTSPSSSSSSTTAALPMDAQLAELVTKITHAHTETIHTVLQQQHALLKTSLLETKKLKQQRRKLKAQITTLERKTSQHSSEEQRNLATMKLGLAELNSRLLPLEHEYHDKQVLSSQQDYLLSHANQNIYHFYLKLRCEIHSLMLSSVAYNTLKHKDDFTQSAMEAGKTGISAGVALLRTAGDVSGSVPLIGSAVSLTATIGSFIYDKHTSKIQEQAAQVIIHSPEMLEGIESIADKVARLLTFRHEEQLLHLFKKETPTYIKSSQASNLAKSMGRKIGAALQEGRILSQSRTGAELSGQMASVITDFTARQETVTALNIPTGREKRIQTEKKTLTDEDIMSRCGIKWLSNDGQQILYATPAGSNPARNGFCWAFGHQVQGISASSQGSAVDLPPAVIEMARHIQSTHYIEPSAHKRATSHRPPSERGSKASTPKRTETTSQMVYGLKPGDALYDITFPGAFGQLLQRAEEQEKTIKALRQQAEETQKRLADMERRMQSSLPAPDESVVGRVRTGALLTPGLWAPAAASSAHLSTDPSMLPSDKPAPSGWSYHR